MITNSTFIPVSEVIGDAAKALNDPEQRKLTPGFYLSAAQRALSTLCHDVDADERHWEADIPESMILQLPFGMTNKSVAMLFNGDHCNISGGKTLYIKPNYYHKGIPTTGAVENNPGSGEDLVQRWYYNNNLTAAWWGNNIFYAGESNGCLYLGPSCAAFEHLHITYTGIGIDKWGCDFNIPEWAREAITNQIIERGAADLWMMTGESRYRGKEQDMKEQNSITNPNGSWIRALRWWSRMDRKQRTDIWTYTSYFGIPPY